MCSRNCYFQKISFVRKQIIVIIQKLVIVTRIVGISFVRVRVPSNFLAIFTHRGTSSFYRPQNDKHIWTHTQIFLTNTLSRRPWWRIRVLVMPNKRLVLVACSRNSRRRREFRWSLFSADRNGSSQRRTSKKRRKEMRRRRKRRRKGENMKRRRMCGDEAWNRRRERTTG